MFGMPLDCGGVVFRGESERPFGVRDSTGFKIAFCEDSEGVSKLNGAFCKFKCLKRVSTRKASFATYTPVYGSLSAGKVHTTRWPQKRFVDLC